MKPEEPAATFEAFVRRTAASYQVLARRYVRDSGEAEDVVQTAFLKAWRRWASVQKGPGVDAWVARIVRNECIDRWRREQRHRRFEAASAREGFAVGVSRSPLGTAEDPEERDLDRVREIIRETPEPYRSVLVLRFIEKLTYDDIARRLGRPLGTVKTNLCRAVRHVRLKLRAGGRQRSGDGT